MIINYNGSKWYGQKADPIEVLYKVLSSHILRKDCNRIELLNAHTRRFWGNFFDISHAFSVDVRRGSTAEKKLLKLFKVNRSSPAYRDQQ